MKLSELNASYRINFLPVYQSAVPPEPSTVPPSMLERVRHACRLFDQAQETTTQTETLQYYRKVDAGRLFTRAYLLQYVQTFSWLAIHLRTCD